MQSGYAQPTWYYNPYVPWTGYNNQTNPYGVSPNGYSGLGTHVQQSTNNLLRVTGPESAKAYPVAPNSNVVLFDANEAIFYLLSSDDSGFKSLRTFDFSERKPVDVPGEIESFDTSGFASKDDVEELKKQLADISESLKGLM